MVTCQKHRKDKALHVLLIICLSVSTIVVASNPLSTNTKRNGNWLGNILGTSGMDQEEDLKVNEKTYQQPPPPPPPPSKVSTSSTRQQTNAPPPPLPRIQTDYDQSKNVTLDSMTNAEEIARDGTLIRSKDEMLWSQDQPPPGHWGINESPQGDTHQYWHAHPQHADYPYRDYQSPPWQHPNQQHYSTSELQAEIESLLSHQYELYSQIHNLTHTLSESDRKFDIQMSQIDLLLEQVADAEAHASAESNAALEHKTNCTRLAQDIVLLEQKIEDWEKKYETLDNEKQLKDEEISELRSKLKKKERELENMACGIEMARLENERAENSQTETKKKNQNNGGLFHWIFGWIWGDGSNSFSSTRGYSLNNDDSDSEELEKLQELARSTLLQALQSERDNVEELEAALSVAQQNNTAIAEMVSSRDSLVNELNDRISVFEEDKIVLKAALKQLQKEMKDEAPKTLQLIDDLNSAKESIKKLEDKMKAMKKNHIDEIRSLDAKLVAKDKIINETDSKMSMISTYVDQLEERLASFSIAKKQIADREEECNMILARSKETEMKLSQLEVYNKSITEERDEFKNLVNLMVEERNVLLGEKERLMREKDSLAFEVKTLKEELDLLNDNFLRIEAEAINVKDQIIDLTEKLNLKEETLISLKNENSITSKKLSEQDHMIDKSITLTMNMQEEIRRLSDEKDEAEKMIFILEQKLADVMLGNNTRQVMDGPIDVDTTGFIPPPPPPPPPQIVTDDRTSQDDSYSDKSDVEETDENLGSVLYPDIENEIVTPDIGTSKSDSEFDSVAYQEGLDDKMDLSLEQRLSDDEHDAVVEGDTLNDFDEEDTEINRESKQIVLDPESEPPFPNSEKTHSDEKMIISHSIPRNVPFRTVRKTFAKMTDMHGVFTPKSSSIHSRKLSHDKGKAFK